MDDTNKDGITNKTGMELVPSRMIQEIIFDSQNIKYDI